MDLRRRLHCPNNSLRSTLSASDTWTGVGQQANASVLELSAHVAQNCTLVVQQGPDNSNWDYTSNSALTAGSSLSQVRLYYQWFRVRVVNGGVSNAVVVDTFTL